MNQNKLNLLSVTLSTCFILNLIFGCNKTDSYKSALNQSGTNLTELEQLINHYSQNLADSLKLVAAKYLISNMSGNYCYKGRQLNNFNNIFNEIAEIESRTPGSTHLIYQ